MNRSSYQTRPRVWLAMFISLPLLLVSDPNSINAQRTAQSRRPEIKEEKITRAILQITNKCPQPHHFRINSDVKDPRVKQQTDGILVGARSKDKIEIVFDSTGLGTSPKAFVECLDCKKAEGCVQDRYEIPIEMISVNTASRGGIPVSTKWSFASYTKSGAVDVGIIPETPGGCPIGSEQIYINMDDQDDVFLGTQNNSSVQGWTGGISRYSTGTTFSFCRVDGNKFRPFFSDYAVLQLGSTCPPGSFSFKRKFDNENDSTNNWSSGDIGPNANLGSPPQDWELYFCFFPGPWVSMFPTFYVPYGVFGAPSTGWPWYANGIVHTDDEDDNPQLDGTSPSNTLQSYRFSSIIYGTDFPFGGRNSELLVAKASNDTCQNVNPCPYIGSYDGANCWVGQPPKKTQAFIWATNFYYTPAIGAQKCPMAGSWYDGANCFMKAIPQNTTPFIWSNMWYVQPVCRP